MAIKDRRTRGAAFVLRPAAFAALALLAAKSHGAEIDVGVGAGANMHQISRFENATVP